MSITPLALFVALLATFRITRWVIEDDNSEWLRKWANARVLTRYEQHDLAGKVINEKFDFNPKAFIGFRWLFKLTTCHWCLSVWTGGGVIALLHWQGSWFKFVCYALSCSSVTGLLHSLSEWLDRH